MGLLRTLLALSVLVSHSVPFWGFKGVGGVTAVQSFYMISGFYMSLILTEKYVGKNGKFSLFISNRFLRLYPIYWAVVLLTLFYRGQFLSFFQPHASFNGFTDLFIKFSNIFIFGQDVVMFLGVNTETGRLFWTSDFLKTDPKLYSYLLVPQAWTLGLELTFYLVAPFLLRLKWRWTLLVMVLSAGLRLWLYSHGLRHDPWTDRFFPTEIFFFLAGRLAYEIYRRTKNIKNITKYSWGAFIVIMAITLFYPGRPIYYGIFFCCLPFVFQLTKKSKLDTWVGELSYPIYICHALVIEVLAQSYPQWNSRVGLMTLAFSVLLNVFIAVPVERLRQGRVPR